MIRKIKLMNLGSKSGNWKKLSRLKKKSLRITSIYRKINNKEINNNNKEYRI